MDTKKRTVEGIFVVGKIFEDEKQIFCYVRDEHMTPAKMDLKWHGMLDDTEGLRDMHGKFVRFTETPITGQESRYEIEEVEPTRKAT